MITNINLENEENKFYNINKFFKKDYKIKYNRKLSGKVKLYISERNEAKNFSRIALLYKNELH